MKRRLIAAASALVLLLAALSLPLAQGPAPTVPAGKRPAALAGKPRPAALAGSWYPDEKASVVAEVHRLMRAGGNAPTLKGKPIALVVPHAGWRYSGAAAGTAFRLLKEGDFSRVVVVAPSHHGSFDGFALDDAVAYATPLGEIPLSAEGVEAIRDASVVRKVPGVAEPEHAVEIELPFLQETLRRFDLVPILAGRTTPEQQRILAKRLAKLHDGKTLFVFSSDFTHYGPRFGYSPYGPTAQALAKIRDLNGQAIAQLALEKADGFRSHVQETGNSICGHAGLEVMLELLPLLDEKAKPTLLAHYASGEMKGINDDSSVSYVAIAFGPDEAPAGRPLVEPPGYTAVSPDAPPLSDQMGDRLVRLARATLSTQYNDTGDLHAELLSFPTGLAHERLQAIFVTLNRTDPKQIAEEGKLRGCVGQVFPAYPIYQAVVQSAVAAALHDRRFQPVEARELPGLEVEVTVLSVPRPVASYSEIQIGKHGIVLEKDGRRALFLPQVPGEEGWNLEQTLTALARKAGLPGDGWREGARFSVFTGQVFEEKHAR